MLYPDIANDELRNIGNPVDLLAARSERLKLQNDARTTLIQALGAALFLLTAYFGWLQAMHGRKQLTLAQDESIHARRQESETLRLLEQAQITDRFTRAVEQLGNTNVDVRLGGLYGLARINRDTSDQDEREAIARIMIAYIRNRSEPASSTRQRHLDDDATPESRYASAR